MSFKALMISMQQDMIDVAKANKRVEAKQRQAVLDDDGIYMHSIYPKDRHDSDADELKKESADLRNYDFLRDDDY
jgi:hypothetical protein